MGVGGAQRHHDRVLPGDGLRPRALSALRVRGRSPDDAAPTPSEFLLHALASCLTAGIANIAAARGIALSEVSSTVEAELNLLGVLGLSDAVRNGYERIRVSVTIKGDAPPEALQAIVEQSRKRSPVLDVLTNGVAVELAVD
jgi:uncharacterized OsmC-like protein